jgi:hypothetical protein
MRNAHKILFGNSEERDHLEDPGIVVKIILKWILRKQGWSVDWIHLA